MTGNIQGIIRKTTSNMTNEFDKIAYITQNVANANTNGYKAVRFESMIDVDGSVHSIERVDTSAGEYINTKNPLDIAITGAGYIPVTNSNGEIRYTRDGSFTVNKDGMLITKIGALVGSGIKIDGTAEKIKIEKNGDVFTYYKKDGEPEYVGTIPLVQFENPEALKDVGGSEFVPTEGSGKMKLVENHKSIKQYGIEHSNIDMMAEIYSVSRINASIIASAKLMQAVKGMYRKFMDANS